MKITAVDATLFLLPITSGFLTSSIFRVDPRKSEHVMFRPPAAAFGVVWSILYLLIGFAWVQGNRKSPLANVPFGILTALLVAWIIAYKYSEPAALVILVCSIAAALACSQVTKFILAPLIAWLIYALLLMTVPKISTSSKGAVI